MKIRIKDNSVRLRLTQSEIAKLGNTGMVESTTAFVGRPFIYAVQRTIGGQIDVAFVDNRIVLSIPASMVHELVTTQRVGFEGIAGSVKLLVEKDFACLDNTVEDQSDNYPNPNLQC